MKIQLSCALFVISTLIPTTISAGFLKNLNMKEAQIHFEAAQKFENSGDPNSAMSHYAKALQNAHLAKAPPKTISMLTYNYGRMLGHTCNYEEAEKYLMEALEIEKSVTGPDSEISSMRLFELARLHQGNDEYKKSVSYYSKAIPIGEKLGAEQSDPIGYSLVLDGYVDALKKINSMDTAAIVSEKSRKIKESNPNKDPGFVPRSYKCEK